MKWLSILSIIIFLLCSCDDALLRKEVDTIEELNLQHDSIILSHVDSLYRYAKMIQDESLAKAIKRHACSIENEICDNEAYFKIEDLQDYLGY